MTPKELFNKMNRQYVEKEVMDTVEEALAYDRIIRLYYYWLNRPQVNLALQAVERKIVTLSRERELLLLDIGTGTARIPIAIAKRRRDSKIYAVDLSSNMLKVAAENIKRENLGDRIILKTQDANALTFENNFFDVVMCSGMLHHQKEPVGVLREIKRVAKDDGIIVINDPVRPPTRFFVNLFVGIFGIVYDSVQKKGYRDTLYSAFSVKELQGILQDAGITDCKVYRSFPHFVTFVKE